MPERETSLAMSDAAATASILPALTGRIRQFAPGSDVGLAIADARREFDADHRVEARAIAFDESADAAAEIGQHRLCPLGLCQRDMALHQIGGLLAGDVADIGLEIVRELVPVGLLHCSLPRDRVKSASDTCSRFPIRGKKP